MKSQMVGIAALLLDPQNPRRDPVKSQREALTTMIEEQGSKLTTLARDIAENGLSPLDRVLVVRSGRSHIVLEGNRRVAAVKLLHNPGLAAHTPIAAAIKRIADTANPPDELECVVADSRDQARRWLVLRHTGEQDGAGVVQWSSLSSNRFSHRPGSQAAKAITFIESVEKAYPQNQRIQDALDTIASTRLTTLGRLVADPNFRTHLGLEEVDGDLHTHYPTEAIETIVERVLVDVATDLSVTQLKTKDLRHKYLGNVSKPNATAYKAISQPLASGGATTTPRQPTARRPPRPGSPFKDLDLQKLGPRLNDIVLELRRLDITKAPNAAAIMTRVLLELSVDEFIAKKGLSSSGELKNRVKRALHEVDSSDVDAKYQGVRSGLSDGTSMFAVATLHGYVHNANFHPTPIDIRGFVSNLKPFLQAMNDLV